MTQKSELGQLGEEIACEYLKNKKYRILGRNFRKPWGELDIIARAPDKTLVFVEVKTMDNFEWKLKPPDPKKTTPALLRGFGGLRPEDQVTSDKLKKIKRTAALYAGENQNLIKDKKGWRLDAIAIEITGPNPESSERDRDIRHYENVH